MYITILSLASHMSRTDSSGEVSLDAGYSNVYTVLFLVLVQCRANACCINSISILEVVGMFVGRVAG